MNNNASEYFSNMSTIGHAFEDARQKRNAEKEILVSQGRWDEVKAWNEREKEFPFPFTSGQMKAYWAFKASNANQSSTFEVQDLPWGKDAHDFITCLKEAGITEFAITDHSTALMELLHTLADEEGCEMVGLCKVTRSERRWGEDGTVEYDGILMRI